MAKIKHILLWESGRLQYTFTLAAMVSVAVTGQAVRSLTSPRRTDARRCDDIYIDM